MRLYRIAEERFAADLAGEGARLYGGRWNPKGISLIYTAESVALAALEVLVRLVTPKEFFLVKYQVDDQASVETVAASELPATWLLPHPNPPLMNLGKKWAQEKRSLLLKVPSAVVRGEGWNYLINPLHPEFSMVVIEECIPFAFDARLMGGI